MKLDFTGKISIAEIIDQYVNSKKNSRRILPKNYQNTLFFGDNLLGLEELITSGYLGKIDLIYIDPPFATNSTFRDTKFSGSAISTAGNAQLAYTDRNIGDDYLAFMWIRLVLLWQLLSEQGTIYVHSGLEYASYLRVMLEEIFGKNNFLSEIARIKSNPKNFARSAFGNQHDIILVFAKQAGANIWNEVKEKLTATEIKTRFPKKDANGRCYTTVPLHAPGETITGETGLPWRDLMPPTGRHWRKKPAELEELDAKGKIEWSKTGNPRLIKFADEHQGKKYQDVWLNFKDPQRAIYPTEKNNEMLKLIIEQSSNRNSTVLDIFAGGGTTLSVAKKLGRNFIGMDCSVLAKHVISAQIPNLNLVDLLSPKKLMAI